MGILSRGLQGFAQGAGDYMKAELKDEMSERGWLRRQAYLEKQRALVRDEDRAFNIDQANIKMLSEQDREDELALEKEDMRQLNLKEQAEIRKNTRLQNIEDQKDSEQRRHLRDTGVRNSWWGSGSQKNFNAELGNLADREFGKTYDDTEEENLTIKEWRDAKAKYISEVENELLTGDHKTIFDWKQWKNKPETSTPTPQTTIEPDSRTGATTQNKDDKATIRFRTVSSHFNKLPKWDKKHFIDDLISKYNQETLSPKELSDLSIYLGEDIKDKSSISAYIYKLSKKSMDDWIQKPSTK
jgi:hypothetical protein